ncbi:MAG: S8 family serine peptidase [Terriglobia bacterium]
MKPKGRGIIFCWLALIILLLGVQTHAAVKDQFLLRVEADEADEVAALHGLTILSRLESQDLFLVQGPPGADPQTLIDDVLVDARVSAFEVNSEAVLPESPPDVQLNQSTVAILDALADRNLMPYFGNSVWAGYVNQPAAGVIRVADAHTFYATGTEIVAVIDTGVDPNHEALADSLVPGFDFTRNLPGFASEWNDLDQSTVAILDQSTVSILDGSIPAILNQSTVAILDQSTVSILDGSQLPAAFGHGTMVAGLVHLVAPTAQIMPLKAFKADGSSNAFDIIRAIYFAVDNGARVINMSFSLSEPSGELIRAITFAAGGRFRVLSVASAGNSAQGTVLVFPAALQNVVSVASTDNLDVLSPFSNFGPALVSLAAPGEGLITTYPGNHYAAAWGTSFSAALVSGGGALLLQIDPRMSQNKSAATLIETSAQSSPDLGAGRLDLVEALAKRAR